MEEKNNCIAKSITLSNNVADVPILAGFVEEVCEEAGINMATMMQLNLAIEEAVVNVMDYAYPAGTEGDVLVDAKVDNGQLHIIITDKGTPFDPTAKADVDTTLSAEERNIGGLGIHLIRTIMDDVIYEEFKGTGNMELVLNRKLQERRVFPAIDIQKSGTRREDLLLNSQEMMAADMIHKLINDQNKEDKIETILMEMPHGCPLDAQKAVLTFLKNNL